MSKYIVTLLIVVAKYEIVKVNQFIYGQRDNNFVEPQMLTKTILNTDDDDDYDDKSGPNRLD